MAAALLTSIPLAIVYNAFQPTGSSRDSRWERSGLKDNVIASAAEGRDVLHDASGGRVSRRRVMRVIKAWLPGAATALVILLSGVPPVPAQQSMRVGAGETFDASAVS